MVNENWSSMLVKYINIQCSFDCIWLYLILHKIRYNQKSNSGDFFSDKRRPKETYCEEKCQEEIMSQKGDLFKKQYLHKTEEYIGFDVGAASNDLLFGVFVRVSFGI